jgi:type 1 glutamine amidotransferase
LEWIEQYPADRKLVATYSSDYTNLDRWLKHAHILLAYCSGPVADDANTEVLQWWLEGGGRMVGIHGTSGGFARRVTQEQLATALYPGEVHFDGNAPRQYVKKSFHDTLGAFFMAHPPIHTFPVNVTAPSHPVVAGLPAEFEVADELYLFELQGDLADYTILLTTDYDIMGVDMQRSDYAYQPGYPWDPTRKIKELHQLFREKAPPKQSEMMLDRDPGEKNSKHPTLGGDRNKRVLAYERKVGKGGVLYIGIGHTTVGFPGRPGYKGSWVNPTFEQLVKNAIAWAASVP